jgi:mannose-6-phosphate isomerase-like protein (cupin superfamily)
MKIIKGQNIEYVPSSHEDQQNPNVFKKVLLEKEDLLPGRVQMVNWAKLQPNATFNAHYHEDMSEVFIIIEGTTEMTVGKTTVPLTKGDLVVVEPGEVHTMTNTSDKPFEYIVFGISQEKGGKTVNV